MMKEGRKKSIVGMTETSAAPHLHFYDVKPKKHKYIHTHTHTEPGEKFINMKAHWG